jgi:CubicO group peptidase (beta-lactamase class C family)
LTVSSSSPQNDYYDNGRLGAGIQAILMASKHKLGGKVIFADFAMPKTAAALGIGQSIELPPERQANNRNWTLAPFNRWSFQRVQHFTRTTRVPRAARPSELGNNFQDLAQITFQGHSGQQCTFADMLVRTYTDGILVLQNGKVVTEQYFNGMERSTLHLIMSCSKSITSAVAGIYVNAGVLDASAQITDYIPELADTGMSGATVQHALDMQVGVKFSEDYDDPEGEWNQYELATGWREASDYDGPRDQISYAQTLTDQEAEHGTVFHYQSILTNIVGHCLERATGRPFTELLAEHIWGPMGAEHDLVSIVDSTGALSFEGGFNICLRDFARFGMVIARNGFYDGTQLGPEDWLEECRNPGAGLVSAFSAGKYAETAPGGAYHNFWWVNGPPSGVIMALGVGGQILYIDSENDFVAVKFSSQPKYEDVEMETDELAGLAAIAANIS